MHTYVCIYIYIHTYVCVCVCACANAPAHGAVPGQPVARGALEAGVGPVAAADLAAGDHAGPLTGQRDNRRDF